MTGSGRRSEYNEGPIAHAIRIMSTTRVAPVSATILCRRDLSIRHAEGYLYLISACSGLWDPSPAVRDPLGRRAWRRWMNWTKPTGAGRTCCS